MVLDSVLAQGTMWTGMANRFHFTSDWLQKCLERIPESRLGSVARTLWWFSRTCGGGWGVGQEGGRWQDLHHVHVRAMVLKRSCPLDSPGGFDMLKPGPHPKLVISETSGGAQASVFLKLPSRFWCVARLENIQREQCFSTYFSLCPPPDIHFPLIVLLPGNFNTANILYMCLYTVDTPVLYTEKKGKIFVTLGSDFS